MTEVIAPRRTQREFETMKYGCAPTEAQCAAEKARAADIVTAIWVAQRAADNLTALVADCTPGMIDHVNVLRAAAESLKNFHGSDRLSFGAE